MYKVSSLQLGRNLGVRLVTDNYFYLRLTGAKMHVSAVFIEKYL